MCGCGTCASAFLTVESVTALQSVDERGLLRLKLPNDLSPHQATSPIIQSICCFSLALCHEGVAHCVGSNETNRDIPSQGQFAVVMFHKHLDHLPLHS